MTDGALVPVTCRQCGAVRMQKPSRADRPYCSQQCYWDASRTGRKPRDPIKRRASRSNAKAKRRGRPEIERIDAEGWAERLEYFGNRCAYCNRSADLEMEHIVPISKGGLHGIDNIVPACHGCNASKRDRSLVAWLQWKIDPPKRYGAVH